MSIEIPNQDMAFSAGQVLMASDLTKICENIDALSSYGASLAEVKRLIPTFVSLTAFGDTGSTSPIFSITTNTGSTITGSWENNGTGCILRNGCNKVVMVKGDVMTNTTVTANTQLTRTALTPVQGSSSVYYSVPYFENQGTPTMARQTYASAPSVSTATFCPAGTSYNNPSTNLNAMWLHYTTILEKMDGTNSVWFQIIDKTAGGVEVKERVIARSRGQDRDGVPTPYCQIVSSNSWTAKAMLEIWEEA